MSQKDSRKQMLMAEDIFGGILAGHIKERREIYDELAPRWGTITTHDVGFPDPYFPNNPNAKRLDVVTELPGRIFIRGWDETGCIHNMPKCGQ